MDNETLRKVQLVQLEIAKEIARVCEENRIPYFLTGGTLLGAVRHKGFIPWDDDLDMGMMRNDYEKFMQVAPQQLSDKYKLVDWKFDPDYPHPMGKVIKKGTVYKESKRNDLGEQGIWVDVFPYDGIQDLGSAWKKRAFQLKVLRGILRAKGKYQTWHSENGIILSKYLKNIPFRILAAFTRREKLIEKYESLSVQDNGRECKYVYENGEDDYSGWCFPIEYFSSLIPGEFEGASFLIPQKYHDLLTSAYGDYMQLPPEGQRENRHLIDEVCLGE